MLLYYLKKALAFRQEAQQLLSKFEESPHRVVTLKKSYEDLGKLSIKQDELFRQALGCCESSLYRSAHVMAWAGFMDFLEEKIASDGFKKLHQEYPKWNYSTLEDIRENVSEFQLIEAAKRLGLCGKNVKNALQGMLSKRNECAHPSSFCPGLNETLGYISELFQRIKYLQPMTLLNVLSHP